MCPFTIRPFGQLVNCRPNQNCEVDLGDLAVFRSVLFPDDEDADFDGNGIAGLEELGLLRQQIIGEPGPSGIPNDCDD